MNHHLFMYHNARTGQWRGHFPHLSEVLSRTTGDHPDQTSVITEARDMLLEAIRICEETGAPVPISRPPRDGEYVQPDEPEFGLIKYVTMLA